MVEHTDALLLHIQLIRGSEWAFSPTEDVLDLVRIAEWWQVLEEGGEEPTDFSFAKLDSGLKPFLRVFDED